jgi:HSP90 family molecular chaperone
MERIMRAQTFSDSSKIKDLASSRTLELNPRHPVVIEMKKLAQEKPDEQSTKDLAWLLHDTALLASGFTQDDTEGFSERMYRTIATSLNVKSMALAEELEVTVDEEEEKETSDSSNSDESHEEL